MGNLAETTAAIDGNGDWQAGIYELTTDDIVLGGPDGIDNLQAKQLLARINLLKAMALAVPGNIEAAIAALVNSSPAALDTLNELAVALGNDPNFATTITNALAGKVSTSQKASTAQAEAGADDETWMTPLKTAQAIAALASVVAASEIVAGKVELATNAETITGTDTVRATHPAGVKAAINAAIAALINSSPGTLDTLNELATALGNDPNFATTITNALAAKAPLASPALTGTPTAPTAAANADDTQIATTAFVRTVMASSISQIALANMRMMINTAVTSGPLVLGRQWELLSNEWATGSTGYTFVAGSPSYYRRTPSGYEQITTSGKTYSGNLTSGGGVAAAFDGNTSQDLSTGSYCTGGSSEGFVIVDLGVGGSEVISKCEFYSSSNYGYSNNASDYNTNCITLTLYGATHADPSTWVQLCQVTGVNNTTGGVQVNALNVSDLTAYRYLKGAISRTGGGSIWGALSELRLFRTNVSSDAILVSPTVSLAASPPYADLVFGYKDDHGASVLGTDFLVEFQRDGALWTPATTYALLTPAAGLDGTFMAVQARANLGSQGAGTNLRTRVSILNKDQRFALPVLCSE